MSEKSQVVICGAGPVGLIAALKFAKAGLTVTMFDAGEELNDSPRACVYAHASLHAFDSLGILDDVEAIAHVNRSLGFYSPEHDWRLQTEFHPEKAGRYDRTFHIGQEEVGTILLNHLQAFDNFTIHWGTRLTGIEQDDESITAHVETANGQSSFTGEWLVGADGANSTARALAGIEFEGHTWPERWFATNVDFDFGKIGYGDGVMRMDPKSWAIIVRVNAHGVWRIAFGESSDLPAEDCIERATARLSEFIPKGEEYNVLRLNPYSVHQRAAETLRSGRLILAGDAAHATNPTGGLGLTTGTWDAMILGDILPAVVIGEIGDEALDAYSKERLRVFWEYTSPAATENKRRNQEADPEKRKQDREQIEMMVANPDMAAFLPKMSYMVVGDPIIKASPWSKFKDMRVPQPGKG